MTMTPAEVESVLQRVLRPEAVPLDPPTVEDWRQLESRFGCRFGNEFKSFIALMSKYQFPGDILNVSSGRTNGNDSIELAFEYESQESGWDANMIPFYAIGNGDYFCLSKEECPASRVFYYYADRKTFEPYSGTVEDWIQQLPLFLA